MTFCAVILTARAYTAMPAAAHWEPWTSVSAKFAIQLSLELIYKFKLMWLVWHCTCSTWSNGRAYMDWQLLLTCQKYLAGIFDSKLLNFSSFDTFVSKDGTSSYFFYIRNSEWVYTLIITRGHWCFVHYVPFPMEILFSFAFVQFSAFATW